MAATRGSQTWEVKDGFACSFHQLLNPPPKKNPSFSLLCEPAGPGEGFNLREQRIPWQRSTVTDGRRLESRLWRWSSGMSRNFFFLQLVSHRILCFNTYLIRKVVKDQMFIYWEARGGDNNPHVSYIPLSDTESRMKVVRVTGVKNWDLCSAKQWVYCKTIKIQKVEVCCSSNTNTGTFLNVMESLIDSFVIKGSLDVNNQPFTMTDRQILFLGYVPI